MSAVADRRRVLGPVDSVKLTSKEKISSPKNGKWLYILPSTVANATGSAYIEAGSTKIQCTVYGPNPIRGSFTQSADLSVEVEFSPFCSHAEYHSDSNTLSREIGLFVESCFAQAIMLDLYPKSAIKIVVSIISASPNIKSTVSAAINASTVALADAGISLSDLITSGSAVIAQQKGEQVLLSDGSETSEVSSETPVDALGAFFCALDNKIAGTWISGSDLAEPSIEKALTECIRQASEVRQVINGVLIDRLKQQDQAVEH